MRSKIFTICTFKFCFKFEKWTKNLKKLNVSENEPHWGGSVQGLGIFVCLCVCVYGGWGVKVGWEEGDDNGVESLAASFSFLTPTPASHSHSQKIKWSLPRFSSSRKASASSAIPRRCCLAKYLLTYFSTRFAVRLPPIILCKWVCYYLLKIACLVY